MADQLSANDVATALGAPIMTAMGAAISWLAAGSFGVETALKTLLTFIGGVSFLLFLASFRRYSMLLEAGNAKEGSLDRKGYERLRKSLAGDNLPARLYAQWLTKFLNRIEHFFGDAGMADRTLFPHAFGLKEPRPLWTGPAFDRCLLLALIYPIATIFLIWAVSGHVGPAEEALGIMPGAYAQRWQRGLLIIALGFSAFTLWRFNLAKGWRRLVWALSAVAAGISTVVSTVVAGVAARNLFFAVILTATTIVIYGSAATGGVGVISVAGVVAAAANSTGDFEIIAMVASGAFIVVLALSNTAIKRGWQGPFLAFSVLVMIVICFLAVPILARSCGEVNDLIGSLFA